MITQTPTESIDLAARLEKLERQYRRIKLFCGAVAAGLATVALGTMSFHGVDVCAGEPQKGGNEPRREQGAQGNFHRVEAGEFVLKDQSGRVRARLRIDKSVELDEKGKEVKPLEYPVFELYGETGRPRVVLKADKERSSVVLSDEGVNSMVVLEAERPSQNNLHAALSLQDKGHAWALGLSQDKGSLICGDPADKVRFVELGFRDGGSFIKLTDRKGKEIFSKP
jgi:hypothetical protein